jgi:hypothetical protein
VSISSNADTWSLVCALFARSMPLFLRDFPYQQREVLPALGSGIVRSTVNDLRSALCPFCYQHQGEVEAMGEHPIRLACRCPECGLVELEPDHATRISVDPLWLARQLRGAMSINSHDQPQQIAEGVWRIGEARRTPVVLARDIKTLMIDPNLIDRLRTKSSQQISVIAPNGDATETLMSKLGLSWLRLEERFSWYGNRVSFDAPSEPVSNATPDLSEEIVGPFSDGFKLVRIDAWPHGLISLSDAQAAVFRVLHEAGRALSAEEVMRKAGLASEKPGDVFKIKTKNKGDPAYEGQSAAFRSLISVNQRLGVYSLISYQ